MPDFFVQCTVLVQSVYSPGPPGASAGGWKATTPAPPDITSRSPPSTRARLRCGTHEAHRTLPTTPGEHATIGDYTLTIEERVTPLCQEADGLLLSEYPMLICHVRLSVRRVETSVGAAEERMWEELLG